MAMGRGMLVRLASCAIVAAALAVLPAGAACALSGEACDGNEVGSEILCCDGLVCGPGQTCEPGCVLGGAFYPPGATNPANDCEICDPDAETGRWSDRANGASCDDGNACTRVDACNGGRCEGSDPVVCDPGDACHLAGVCDPATGLCNEPVAPDGTTCDAGFPGSTVRTCRGGACDTCCPDPDATPRFTDNGNGTITDRTTCLVWEKKVKGGALEHGVDRRVDLANLVSIVAPLINAQQFGERRDWRAPELAEIERLVDCGAGRKPCIDPIFGPTKPEPYWTTTPSDPGKVWAMDFARDGGAVSTLVGNRTYFRVVRGASHCTDGARNCDETSIDSGGSCPERCGARFCLDAPSCGTQCLAALSTEGECFCGFNGRCPDAFCNRSADCPAGWACMPNCGCEGPVCVPPCGAELDEKQRLLEEPRVAGRPN